MLQHIVAIKPSVNIYKVHSLPVNAFALFSLSVGSLFMVGCSTTPLAPNQAALKAVKTIYEQPNYQIYSSSKIATIDITENSKKQSKIALVPAPQDAEKHTSKLDDATQENNRTDAQKRKKEQDSKMVRIATDLIKQLITRQSIEAITTVDALNRQVEFRPAIRYQSKNASSFFTIPMLLDFKTSHAYADFSGLSPLLTNSKFDDKYVDFDISKWTQKVDLEKLYAYSKNIQTDTFAGIKPEAFKDIDVPASASSKGVKRMVALQTSLDDYFASSAAATEKRKPDLLLALKYQAKPDATAVKDEKIVPAKTPKTAEDVLNGVLDAYAQKDYSKQLSEIMKGFIDPSSSISVNYGLDNKGTLLTQDTTCNVVLKNDLPLKGAVTLVSQSTIDYSSKARIGFLPSANNVVSFSEASKDTLVGELINTATSSYSDYLKKADATRDESATATSAAVDAMTSDGTEPNWCALAAQEDAAAEDKALAKEICDATKAAQKPAAKKPRGGKKHR